MINLLNTATACPSATQLRNEILDACGRDGDVEINNRLWKKPSTAAPEVQGCPKITPDTEIEGPHNKTPEEGEGYCKYTVAGAPFHLKNIK